MTISYLLSFLLMACSGGGGPTSAGPVGGGPVGGLESVSTALVGGGGNTGGNNPQFAHAAAPGTDEVMLGPGEADPGELFATLECERKCESDPDGEGSQLSFKAKHGFKPGQRILRVYEYLNQEHSSSFQDIPSDTDGNFSFVLKGLPSRKVKIFLLKAAAASTPLNKVLPCPDDLCVLDEEGNVLPGFKAECLADIPEAATCPRKLKNIPNINL